MSTLAWILLVVLIIVIVIVICAYVFVLLTCNKYLFYPNGDMKWKPPYEFTDVYINPHTYQYDTHPYSKFSCDNQPETSFDGEYINCWHFKNLGGPEADTIIFYHGNAGNIFQREYVVEICRQFKRNLLLVDYRGFGRSSSYPSTAGCCQDGIAAYKYLSSQINPNKIIIWGESLGGGVATHVASKYQCKSLILMCTFSSIDDAIRYSEKPIPGKSILASMLPMFIDCMPSKDKLKKISCTPIAIIHSDEDELIHKKCAEINYNSIGHECKTMINIKGGHSSPHLDETTLAQLFTFVGVIPQRCEKTKVRVMAQHLRTVGAEIFEY